MLPFNVELFTYLSLFGFVLSIILFFIRRGADFSRHVNSNGKVYPIKGYFDLYCLSKLNMIFRLLLIILGLEFYK